MRQIFEMLPLVSLHALRKVWIRENSGQKNRIIAFAKCSMPTQIILYRVSAVYRTSRNRRRRRFENQHYASNTNDITCIHWLGNFLSSDELFYDKELLILLVIMFKWINACIHLNVLEIHLIRFCEVLENCRKTLELCIKIIWIVKVLKRLSIQAWTFFALQYNCSSVLVITLT